MTPAYDFTPVAALLCVGVALACIPLASVWSRRRTDAWPERLGALTLMTLFLTFDLVLVGAFTRLSDSGLGCPDWPGCYGHATPHGARGAIDVAVAALPGGPVTHAKAWIEMTHRYMAGAIGVLITALAGLSWYAARRASNGRVISPWWPTLTLAWVCLQGAFGAWTVAWKLYPLVVTAHLLAGLGLVALLAAQSQQYERAPLALSPGLRAGVIVAAVLSVLQIALGGWVSTNDAVLACGDSFPACRGSWSPALNFSEAFALRRELGRTADGAFLTFAALTAIHVAHRAMALVVLPALIALGWRLRVQAEPAARRFALAIGAIAVWQLSTGLANVMLGWPLLAAVGHTGGAAALVAVLTALLVRAAQASSAAVVAVTLPPTVRRTGAAW